VVHEAGEGVADRSLAQPSRLEKTDGGVGERREQRQRREHGGRVAQAIEVSEDQQADGDPREPKRENQQCAAEMGGLSP